MRNETLARFRTMAKMSQIAVARETGVTLVTYNRIEKNHSTGTIEFWKSIQRLFNIEDKDMWAVINGRNVDERYFDAK